MIKNRERSYINTVKGIAIVLMIWGHCIQSVCDEGYNFYLNPVFMTIYSFHMPLFMLVSGYLFFYSYQKRDLKTLLVHKTQGLLQPIVFASMLNIILEKFPTLLLHGTFQIGNGRLLIGLYSLWFLWCVLSSSIAVAIAGKLTAKPWLQPFTVLLGFFLVTLFPENAYHMYMYPYFVAGFFFGMYRDRIPAMCFKLFRLCLVLFPLLLQFYGMEHYIYVTPVWVPEMDMSVLAKLNGFRWLIGFVGSGFVLTLTDLLYRCTVDRQRVPLMVKGLEKLGENSLSVYCVSVSLQSYYLSKINDRLMLMAGRNLFMENMTLYNYLYTPLMTVAYCVGLYYVVVLLKKLKIHKLIFGR